MKNTINEDTLIKYVIDYGKIKGLSFNENEKQYFDNRIDYIKNKNDLFNAIEFAISTIK